jgi:hypothetical protein
MTDSNCRFVPKRLLIEHASDLQQGPTEGDDSALEEHLSTCARCRHVVEAFQQQGAALRFLARLDEDEGGALRGRILGTARDRAWGLFRQGVSALMATSRRLETTADERERAAAKGQWKLERDALRCLRRRLAGLGTVVQVHDGVTDEPDPGLGTGCIPARRAMAACRDRLQQLLDLVGEPDPDQLVELGPADDHPHQPTAAPSFLDSLAPW